MVNSIENIDLKKIINDDENESIVGKMMLADILSKKYSFSTIILGPYSNRYQIKPFLLKSAEVYSGLQGNSL